MDLKTLRDTPPWDWPREAGAFLLGRLRDGAAPPADRELAAELVGDVAVIDDEKADALLRVVVNPAEPEALRGAAAIALGPVLEYSDEEGFEDDDLPITEDIFHAIQEALRSVFQDEAVSKEVKRRVLEGSVRAPQTWHAAAVRAAYVSRDPEWKLTAVFCMRYVRGFEEQIVEALESETPELRYEAVCAAGAWAVEAAWPTVAPLLSPKTPKPLLLAAIEAAPYVCPDDAPQTLEPLLASRDEDEEDEEEYRGPWH